MRIPGFTAEASLGKAQDSHNLRLEGSAETARILPQFCSRPAGSNYVTCSDCIDTDGDGVPDTCYTYTHRVAFNLF